MASLLTRSFETRQTALVIVAQRLERIEPLGQALLQPREFGIRRGLRDPDRLGRELEIDAVGFELEFELVQPQLDVIEPLVHPIEPPVDPIESLVDPIESLVDPIEPLVDPIEPLVDPIEPLVDPIESQSDLGKPVAHLVEPLRHQTELVGDLVHLLFIHGPPLPTESDDVIIVWLRGAGVR